MKKNKYLFPAFTLLELIIVLIISAIIVSLAFAALNLVERKLDNVQDNFIQQTSRNILKSKLYLDFNSCQDIYFNKKNMNLLFINPLDTVRYQFNKENIISGFNDTIALPDTKIEVFFLGKKKESGIIDALRISFDERYKIFISRNNDIRTLVHN